MYFSLCLSLSICSKDLKLEPKNTKGKKFDHRKCSSNCSRLNVYCTGNFPENLSDSFFFFFFLFLLIYVFTWFLWYHRLRDCASGGSWTLRTPMGRQRVSELLLKRLLGSSWSKQSTVQCSGIEFISTDQSQFLVINWNWIIITNNFVVYLGYDNLTSLSGSHKN